MNTKHLFLSPLMKTEHPFLRLMGVDAVSILCASTLLPLLLLVKRGPASLNCLQPGSQVFIWWMIEGGGGEQQDLSEKAQTSGLSYDEWPVCPCVCVCVCLCVCLSFRFAVFHKQGLAFIKRMTDCPLHRDAQRADPNRTAHAHTHTYTHSLTHTHTHTQTHGRAYTFT